MNAAVVGLRSVEFRVPDPEASATFYEEAWGVREVARSGRSRWFRAGGAEHHVLALHAGEHGLERINLAAENGQAVDALHERVKAAGAPIVDAPSQLDEPGGGYGFAFRDPDGREFRVSASLARHAESEVPRDRPVRLSHVVLNATQTDAATALMVGALGFRRRDQTGAMDFLGCNADHHSLAFTRFADTGLNHLAFEVASIDALMRGAGRMKTHGYRIEWGVGRHGPGANVFAYFIDPTGFVIEYTAEMQQVDDATYKVGVPEDWAYRGGNNPDAWQLADPPTERFQLASGGRAPMAAAH